MTVGKDVSVLLADVTKNGQTENLELKKLVYLYLINYAKSQPDLAILAVNTFVKARARAPRGGGAPPGAVWGGVGRAPPSLPFAPPPPAHFGFPRALGPA